MDPAQHSEAPILGSITCATPPRDAILTQIPAQSMDAAGTQDSVAVAVLDLALLAFTSHCLVPLREL